MDGNSPMNRGFFMPIVPDLPGAACKDYAFPNVFFPDGEKEEEKKLPLAQAICFGCVEREKCLEFAITHDIAHGIWGGLTTAMRRNVRTLKPTPMSEKSLARRIRDLSALNKTTRQIAGLLNVETSYVTTTLRRSKTLKGANTSTSTPKNSSGDLPSSSASAS